MMISVLNVGQSDGAIGSPIEATDGRLLCPVLQLHRQRTAEKDLHDLSRDASSHGAPCGATCCIRIMPIPQSSL
jgi:hypothetical protein